MNHRALPLAPDWPTRRVFVPQGCDQQGRQAASVPFGGCPCSAGKAACDCAVQPAPAEACTEIGHDDGEPLTPGEAVRFWLTVCAPAFVGVIGFALVVWALKP